MGIVKKITPLKDKNFLVKQDLINLSGFIKQDFKENCKELDDYLNEALEFDEFEKVYILILSIKETSAKVYAKLYPYFYYHYC
ncbi:hypothetical protein [Tenacibaculum soleae]|uniref:hypothetical protein n=1 Tax=Tenacibaculum soleae TaxID=447689 RepID=UPI0023009678|nr:hypothetical protein [Tenacibaculum soleae]